MSEFFYNLRFLQRLLYRRRQHRVTFLLSKVNCFPGMSILDVGCGPDGRSLEVFLPNDYQTVGIDLYDEREVKVNHPQFTYFQQDAQNLGRFYDKQFHLTISIGMMEHICDLMMLKRIASEIDRVSKQFIVVVPWKYAWLEPHFRFPFFQLMPPGLQRTLTLTLNLHNLRDKVRQDHDYIPKNYQWLSNREWQQIFVGSKIYLIPTLETIAIVKCSPVDCLKSYKQKYHSI